MAIQATARYQSLLLDLGWGTPREVPIRRPVDDLISLGVDSVRDTAVYFTYRQKPTAGEPQARDVPAGDGLEVDDTEALVAVLAETAVYLQKTIPEQVAAGLPGIFLAAAREGEKGHLSIELAPFLDRVEFLAGGVRAPDLPTLSAWCLLRAVQESTYTVRDCELCGVPFLSSGRSRYCRRPVLGVASRGVFTARQTCVDAAKVKTYRAKKKKEKKDG